MSSDALRALATAVGLAPEYEDARGDLQTIGDDTLRAVLEALGHPAGDERDLREAAAKLQDTARSGPLPPLITADAGRAIALPGRRSGPVEIRLEGGGRIEGVVTRRRGAGFAPAVDETGYHELVVGDERTTLAVAPAACHWPEGDGGRRSWGIATQIYGLRRPGDGGIGDYTAVAELAEAAAGQGADALAISPVHAMFAADPGRASPYSPSNRLLLNGLLADPAARLGAERVRAAAAALGQEGERAGCEGAELIDWVGAGSAKLALMRRLYDDLDPNDDVARAFVRWRAEAGSRIEDHAVFEVLHDALRGTDGHPQHWRDWGPDYGDPAAPGVARIRDDRAADVGFHAFLQWLAEDGLKAAHARCVGAGMRIGLIADLAVGADGGGSQAWASREDMLTGLNMGAPPDIYNAKGQDWGLAALDPQALHRTGFRAFLEMLRASLAWAGGIRIDHILGLHRVWVVPEGRPPTEGAYLHFPLDDLLRLVTLESVRAEAVVIGEDLGTVPGGLRRKLGERRILGMSVLWFEQEKDRFLAPKRWRGESAGMTTTHDLPTVAGWWSGRDLDWKEKLDLYPDAAAGEQAREERAAARKALWSAFRRAGVAEGPPPAQEPAAAPVEPALDYVARSSARLVLAPIEDLLGAVEQPNLPGTIDEHPNWRRRLSEAARTCSDPTMKRLTAVIEAGRKAAPDG